MEERTFATPRQEESTVAETDIKYEPRSETVEVGTELPLELYEKENNQPYSAEIFDVFNYSKYKETPELDIDMLIEKTDMVDDYIKQELSKRNMELNQDSYNFILNEILNIIGNPEKESGLNKLKRVFNYIYKKKEIDIKERELKELKEQIYGGRQE